MKFLIILILNFVFYFITCFSTQVLARDAETLQSLERIYGACSYLSKDTEIASTHNIINVDSGFDTWHRDLKGVFLEPYNPCAASEQVNQLLYGSPALNIHGTATSGIIHDLTPTAKIIPIVKGESRMLETLDYALNKANGDIINICFSLSGHMVTPIKPNVQDLLIKAGSQNKLVIVGVGNVYSSMDDLPLARDLKKIAQLSNHKFIIVGATTPNRHGQEELWNSRSRFKFSGKDELYKQTGIFGSIYPGEKEDYQQVFVAAPSRHYTSQAWTGDTYEESDERRYFGMTSSAAPVVTALAERLWTNSTHSTASDIGYAIYHGANKDFSGYNAALYGKGLINYRKSLTLLH